MQLLWKLLFEQSSARKCDREIAEKREIDNHGATREEAADARGRACTCARARVNGSEARENTRSGALATRCVTPISSIRHAGEASLPREIVLRRSYFERRCVLHACTGARCVGHARGRDISVDVTHAATNDEGNEETSPTLPDFAQTEDALALSECFIHHFIL